MVSTCTSVTKGGVWQAVGSKTITIKDLIAMFVELNYEIRNTDNVA